MKFGAKFNAAHQLHMILVRHRQSGVESCQGVMVRDCKRAQANLLRFAKKFGGTGASVR
jgi:hypothetical protein